MAWYVHLSLTPDPVKKGDMKAACGAEVKNAEPRFSEDTEHLRICPKCKGLVIPITANGRHYFTFLIPGQQEQDGEAA